MMLNSAQYILLVSGLNPEVETVTVIPASK